VVIKSIFDRARTQPSHQAMIAHGRSWTYAALARGVLDVEAFLKVQNLPPGSRVGLAIAEHRLAWLFILALEKMGHPSTALPIRAKAADLGVRGLAAWITDGRVAPSWSERTIHIAQDFAQRPNTQWNLSAPVAPPTHDERFILLSSGTTGHYKKIASLGWRRDARVQAAIDARRESPNDRHFLGAFGPWTAHGYIQPVRAWTAGGTVIFDQSIDTWRAILEHKPTTIFMTPGVARQLLSSLPDDFPRQPQLKVTVSGGALTPSLLTELHARLTHSIQQSYGSTEVGLVCRTQIHSAADLEEHELVPNAQVEAVDEEDKPVPTGTPGILRLKTQFMNNAYLEDPETSAEFFRHGWFYPGDLGLLTANGRLKLTGRTTEVINFLGDKIASQKLEDSFRSKLRCDDVAMISAPMTAANDVLHIFVVAKETPSPEAYDAAIAPFGSAFSKVSIHQVETLPRTTTGKVLYRELRARLLS
jgi:acyl-coenzyme A synthetase/AMP-(fatty) acid ligase